MGELRVGPHPVRPAGGGDATRMATAPGGLGTRFRSWGDWDGAGRRIFCAGWSAARWFTTRPFPFFFFPPCAFPSFFRSKKD